MQLPQRAAPAAMGETIGRWGYDDGGGVTAPAYPGANPQVQQLYQRYASLPRVTLQQLAARTPQTSAQGQLIQHALKAKQMNPAASGAFASPAPMVAPPGAPATAPGAAAQPNARGGSVRHFDDGGGVVSGINRGDGFTWLGAESPVGAPATGGMAFPTTGGRSGFPSAPTGLPSPIGWGGRGRAGPARAASGIPMQSGYGVQDFPSTSPAAAPASSGSPASGGTSYQRGAYGADLPMMSFSVGHPGEVGPSWSPGQALLSPQTAPTTIPPGFGGTPANPPLLTAAPSGAPVTQGPAPAPAPLIQPSVWPIGFTGGGGWAQGGGIPHLATGGLGVAPTPEQMGMYASRRSMGELYHPGGFLNSPVGGRTDHLPLAVPAESHVIPADVVSGIGQGNSLNGAAQLDQMFHSGPWGVKAMASRAPSAMPRTSRLAAGGMPFAQASGGKPERTTSILAAGGEYVVRPEAVAEMGRRAKRLHPALRRKSDLAAGHDAVDQFILRARKKTVETTRKLPGPVKG